VAFMNEAQAVDVDTTEPIAERIPSWLAATR